MLRQHPAMVDVAVRVLKLFRVPNSNRLKLKVEWWRVSRCNPPRSMGVTQRIELTREQWNTWRPYTWTGRQPPHPTVVL